MDINLLKDTYIKNAYTSKKEEQTPRKDEQAPKSYTNAIADIIEKRIEENSFFSPADISSLKEMPKTDEPKQQAESSKTDMPASHSGTSPEEIQPKEPFVPIDNQPDIACENQDLPTHTQADTEKLQPDAEVSLPAKNFKANIDFAIVGQIFNTYIIVQKDNEMLIIDQHAAHERIYFEELVDEYRRKGIKSQMLMIPVTVDFDPVQFEVVMKNHDTLSELGFECEEFGMTSIIVRAVPAVMTDSEIKDTVTEIASMLEKGTNDIKKTLMEDVLHTMACKRAIKGNSKLTDSEIESLVEKVLSFDSINTCPHGRPIMTSMTKYELEKNFKRIV